MKETIGASLLGVALAVFGATIALGAEQPHWGYAGDVDPQHWAALSPAYEMCGRGRNQSPIDLTGLVGADLKPIRFRYETNAQEIYNTGHSVQANYTPGSTIELDGHVFELKQFHFHAPSENRIGGKAFPLEGHLVHADRSSNLTVVAVMFVEGKANAIVAALWKQIPATAAEKSTLAPQVNAAGLLPGSSCLLPLQRIADHAALFRRCPVAGDERAGLRVPRAGRGLQEGDGAPQQSAGAAHQCPINTPAEK